MISTINSTLSFFYKFSNPIFGLVVAGMFINTLVYPNMGVDASFYLRVTECIADGAIPEHDLRIMYPPLVFYMLLPIKLLVGKAIAFELFLGFMFLVQLINAFMISKISRHYSENKFIQIFAPLLYLFLSFKLEGEYFLLEPFINLWGLLALLLYLKSGRTDNFSLILSGAVALLAFLTKQYGLGYTALLYILILIDNRASLKKVLIKSSVFSLGFVLALLCFIFLFRIVYGVYYDFFAGGRLSVYGEKNIPDMLLALGKYIYIGIYLLALFIPMIFIRLLKVRTHFLAYLVLIILFSVQLYFNTYAHYFILMLPAILIIGVMLFDVYASKNRILVLCIVLLSLSLNEYFIGGHTKNLIFSTHSMLKADIELAKKINEIIPKGSGVYLFSNVKFYYLCHFNPAIPEKYGFSYNNALTSQDLAEILSCAEFLIIHSNQTESSYPLIDRTVNVGALVKSNGFKIAYEVEQYLIFKNIGSQ